MESGGNLCAQCAKRFTENVQHRECEENRRKDFSGGWMHLPCAGCKGFGGLISKRPELRKNATCERQEKELRQALIRSVPPLFAPQDSAVGRFYGMWS